MIYVSVLAKKGTNGAILLAREPGAGEPVRLKAWEGMGGIKMVYDICHRVWSSFSNTELFFQQL